MEQIIEIERFINSKANKMKKKFWYVAFAALCLMGTSTFTSCSDDDDPAPVICPVGETEFTAAKGLQLTYNNNPMLGQKVKFTPNGDKATLTIKSDFDLSGLIGGKANLPLQLQGPGLLPGTPELTLHVDLKVNGDQCSFEGAGEAEYCTYEYQGTVAKGSLNLQFNNVKLKDTSFEGTWNLAPLGEAWGGVPEETPIHFVWEATDSLSIELFPGFSMKMPIQKVVETALYIVSSVPVGTEKKTPAEVLAALFHQVRFEKDGTIVAKYKDIDKIADENWQTSPANLAQYVVTNNGQLKLFLNPVAIMAAANAQQKVGAKDNMSSLLPVLQEAMNIFGGMLQNGIPLSVKKEEGKCTIFLPKETLMPVMTKIVKPLLEDKAVVEFLLKQIGQNPDMGALSMYVKPMLDQLPGIIDSMTDEHELQIGLNFVVSEE